MSFVVCYSGRSAPSAFRLAEACDDIVLNRGTHGDINWGRAYTEAKLNAQTFYSTNKRLMRERFRDNEVPMPRLIYPHSQDLWDTGKVVGRPDRHTKGRGLWIVDTSTDSTDDFARAERGTRRKAGATHWMEWIDAPREYRVHIFLGKSVRISEKAYTDPDNKRAGYTTAKPQHNVDHVRDAAKKAVAAVGLDFGAVDVLADDDECWVLEVNSAPGLGGSMPRLYVDIFKSYMEGLNET